MAKVDLHTHSTLSPDGCISTDDYIEVLNRQILDHIAITDHNAIDFALELQMKLGTNKIIVGEEIETTEGEIIGLFLTKYISPKQSPEKTIDAIKAQGGIVYIPHPFETLRKGISTDTLERIKARVDIIESANGRAFFQNLGPQAHTWAHINKIATFASSDGHRAKALGKTHTSLSEEPTRENLVELCQKGARKNYTRPSLLDILAPKLNRLRKTMRLL